MVMNPYTLPLGRLSCRWTDHEDKVQLVALQWLAAIVLVYVMMSLWQIVVIKGTFR
jgi:hypothetical protein